jgi:D-alanyl-D-alanine carboxypeptidase/D-alanyl-D-alanine-endopeptidase (penicillin-binding protein 4)
LTNLTAAHAQGGIPAPVQQELDKQGLSADSLSFWVEPLARDGAPWYRFPDRLVNPASEMKLVTTMVALDELGPAYRWTTRILTDGKVVAGELKGKLYLRGGGEPNLSWERLGAMLRTLRSQGITRISGDLILDRSLFFPSRIDLTAPPFDDTPDAYYNVVPDALLVSDNLVSYRLVSDATGSTVQISPPLAGVTVDNQLNLNDGACAGWKAGWQPPQVQTMPDNAVHIVLSGSFPRNCKADVELNTLDRNLYIERLVQALWQELGGVWNGQAREGSTPSDAVLLAERQFETLAETIRFVNKNSDAVKARLLYLTLGATAPGNQAEATLVRANGRVLNWLAAHGVGTAGVVIENGSGLSRLERLTPAQLATLLKIAARSRWYPEFASSLPIVALDGTMKNRMNGTAVAGNARLKTGTLRDVAALAGYVQDVNQRPWIVIGIVNDERGARGRPVLDQLLIWVASGAAYPLAGQAQAGARADAGDASALSSRSETTR